MTNWTKKDAGERKENVEDFFQPIILLQFKNQPTRDMTFPE